MTDGVLRLNPSWGSTYVDGHVTPMPVRRQDRFCGNQLMTVMPAESSKDHRDPRIRDLLRITC